jgi:hypothetical protein
MPQKHHNYVKCEGGDDLLRSRGLKSVFLQASSMLAVACGTRLDFAAYGTGA